METDSTSTGLSRLSSVTRGTHLCYFYETRQDLLHTVIPFFQAGLENNEFCLWVISKSELLTIAEAKSSLRRAVPDLDRYLADGSMEILNHEEWFSQGGDFNIQRVISQFLAKLNRALAKGHVGMRVNGSSAWILKRDRQEFREFEGELDKLIAGKRLIVLCTFPLVDTGAAAILDAARTHQFVTALRQGRLERVESPERVQVRDKMKTVKREAVGEPRLERLTPRHREVLALTVQGFSMKEVALMLNISVKTVETHRLNLMGRLGIHDVPSLVRFAIKAGLINLED